MLPGAQGARASSREAEGSNNKVNTTHTYPALTRKHPFYLLHILESRTSSVFQGLWEGAPGAAPSEGAALTCDSAHCAFHEVARVPGHVSSEAVADQVNIPERKVLLPLQKVTEG